MFVRLYAPKALCAQVLGWYVPKALSSLVSMFPSSGIPCFQDREYLGPSVPGVKLLSVSAIQLGIMDWEHRSPNVF